jgi:hypothetical protein
MADFYHQKPSQGFLYHLDFTYASIAGLLAYAPCILESSPQVGVSGGVRPSAPAAAPSGGGPGRRTAECAGCCPLSGGPGRCPGGVPLPGYWST